MTLDARLGSGGAVARALRAGAVTSETLTAQACERADAVDAVLGAYARRFDRHALEAAGRADAAFAAGTDAGPVQGITVGVKDLLCVAEGPTTAQSVVLDPAWGTGRDAAVVTALKRAGAVITGKAALSEFGIGRPDASSPFAVPRNPWDPHAWPGGSSSGTAIGIAAGLFLVGIGTDTGGSIRIPAALCGVCGLKPTYGLVSRAGCYPLARTQDHVGPMARTVADCRTLLGVIGRPDRLARARRRRLATVADGDPARPLRGLRIGVVREQHFGPGDDPAAASCFADMVDVLADLGGELHDIALPLYAATRTASLTVIQTEGLALHRDRLRTRWADYFGTTRATLAAGAFVNGADYVQAQRVRRAARLAIAGVFRVVDLIVTPTATVGAPRYGPGYRVGIDEVMSKIHTEYWSATGLPALAVPMGFTAHGLPLSMQLAGAAFDDYLVTDVGAALQRVTSWHTRVPPSPAQAVVPDEQARPTPPTAQDESGIAGALLDAAGLPATAPERAALARAYPAARARLDDLYAQSPC